MDRVPGFVSQASSTSTSFRPPSSLLPVIFPVIQALGYDPIWFGVVITMLVEIAMISPPDGTVLYVLQGMRRQPGPITDVFMGVLPFMAVYMLAIGILMLCPAIALWLPAAVM